MDIRLPSPALVLLIGPAGSGRSTFAASHFAPTEVLSSDAFRAAVADDPADYSANRDAFPALRFVLERRLRRRRLSVVDASNLTRSIRRPYLGLTARYSVPAFAVVFDLPLELCLLRDGARGERGAGAAVVRRQYADLQRGLSRLEQEGFAAVETFRLPEDVDSARVVRGAVATVPTP